MKRTKLENTSEVIWAHEKSDCAEQVCCIHNRTNHSMRTFPQHFRTDRGIMERTCPHGVGHPDPDQILWLKATLGEKAQYELIHGCDGCCT